MGQGVNFESEGRPTCQTRESVTAPVRAGFFLSVSVRTNDRSQEQIAEADILSHSDFSFLLFFSFPPRCVQSEGSSSLRRQFLVLLERRISKQQQPKMVGNLKVRAAHACPLPAVARFHFCSAGQDGSRNRLARVAGICLRLRGWSIPYPCRHLKLRGIIFFSSLAGGRCARNSSPLTRKREIGDSATSRVHVQRCLDEYFMRGLW